MTTNIDPTAGNWIVTRNGEVYASGMSKRVAIIVKCRLRRRGFAASLVHDVDPDFVTPFSEIGR